MAIHRKSASRTKKVNRSKLRTRKIQRGGGIPRQPKGIPNGTPPKPKKSFFGSIFSRKSRPIIERTNNTTKAQAHLDKQKQGDTDKIIKHLSSENSKHGNRAKRLLKVLGSQNNKLK